MSLFGPASSVCYNLHGHSCPQRSSVDVVLKQATVVSLWRLWRRGSEKYISGWGVYQHPTEWGELLFKATSDKDTELLYVANNIESTHTSWYKNRIQTEARIRIEVSRFSLFFSPLFSSPTFIFARKSRPAATPPINLLSWSRIFHTNSYNLPFPF